MSQEKSEVFGERESAFDVLRRRAEECRAVAKEYERKARMLDSLVQAHIEIERNARSQSDGQSEGGPYIGVGSQAEEALWLLAVTFPVLDRPLTGI